MNAPMPDEFAELRGISVKLDVPLNELSGTQCNDCDAIKGYTCPVCLLIILANKIKRELPALLAAYDRVVRERDKLLDATAFWSYCTWQGMLKWCPERKPELQEFLSKAGVSPYASNPLTETTP